MMIHVYKCTFEKLNNKGADQTARMRRLVCAFVVCTQQSQSDSLTLRSIGTIDWQLYIIVVCHVCDLHCHKRSYMSAKTNNFFIRN